MYLTGIIVVIRTTKILIDNYPIVEDIKKFISGLPIIK